MQEERLKYLETRNVNPHPLGRDEIANWLAVHVVHVLVYQCVDGA